MKIPLPKNFNPPKPVKVHDYQEVAIHLFGLSVMPSQFSIQQLRLKGVIPSHWQFKKSPLKKSGSLSFSFVEGLHILVVKGKVIFTQKRINKDIDLSVIVKKYITLFPEANYQKLQLIIHRIIALSTKSNSGEKFITNLLLNPSQWDIAGQKPHIQLNYFYRLSPSPLILNIGDFFVHDSQQKARSSLVFRGVFESKIKSNHNMVKVNHFISYLEFYQDNITNFNHIIDRDFLNVSSYYPGRKINNFFQ